VGDCAPPSSNRGVLKILRHGELATIVSDKNSP
jgi:hypothetical protein